MTGFRLGPLFVSAAIIVLLLAATADKRVRPVGGTKVDGTIAAAAVTVAAMKNEPAAIEGDEVPGSAAAAPDAVTPKPAVVVDADTAVGEKLRELAGGKFEGARPAPEARSMIEPAAYNVADAARFTSLSTGRLKALLADGTIPCRSHSFCGRLPNFPGLRHSSHGPTVLPTVK
jgi:hypothetical protein